LSRALSTVDDARAEFSQQRSRLQAAEDASDVPLPEAAPEIGGAGGGRSFMHWMQIGFAFSLPLIIFVSLALLIFFWLTGKAP
jgi:hypothetical protein